MSVVRAGLVWRLSHPFQEVEVVLTRRGEDVDVLDGLVSGKLDVVLLTGGEEEADRSGGRDKRPPLAISSVQV
jgi:hypothetical protein